MNYLKGKATHEVKRNEPIRHSPFQEPAKLTHGGLEKQINKLKACGYTITRLILKLTSQVNVTKSLTNPRNFTF